MSRPPPPASPARALVAHLAATAALVGALGASGARADEPEQAYASMAVQNRRHHSVHELTVYAGLLPLDAFQKGFTLSGSYTLHFSELFGWEVIHGFNSFPFETDLRQDLQALEIEPTPFEIVERMLTSNFLFKPVYWKGAWMNDSLIYGEILLVGGGGYAWFTRSRRIAADLGIAFRLYLSTLFSIRFDIRHHVFFNSSIFKDFNVHQEVWTGLGLAISL